MSTLICPTRSVAIMTPCAAVVVVSAASYSVSNGQTAERLPTDTVQVCALSIAATDAQQVSVACDVDMSDHQANARALLDADATALTAEEHAASVEWEWKPGLGLVRVG
jgi:hypothetical protein